MSDPKLAESEFQALLEFVEETNEVLNLSIGAIVRTDGLRRLTEVVTRSRRNRSEGKGTYDDPLTAEEQEAVDRAEQIEALGQQQLQQGFPLLYAHSVVAIWSALEANMPKFAARWLETHPDARKLPDVEAVRLSVGQHETMSLEQRCEYVVEELMKTANVRNKPGVGGYQALLKAIGLGGGISDELRKDLFEMSQVRNLIVHKFSIADQRFLEACPWYDIQPGERLKVDHDTYHRYVVAVTEYAAQVIERSRAVVQE